MKPFSITITGTVPARELALEDLQCAGRAIAGVLREAGIPVTSAALVVETPRLEAHHLPASRVTTDLMAEATCPQPSTPEAETVTDTVGT